jgi:hypothetical protein
MQANTAGRQQAGALGRRRGQTGKINARSRPGRLPTSVNPSLPSVTFDRRRLRVPALRAALGEKTGLATTAVSRASQQLGYSSSGCLQRTH